MVRLLVVAVEDEVSDVRCSGIGVVDDVAVLVKAERLKIGEPFRRRVDGGIGSGGVAGDVLREAGPVTVSVIRPVLYPILVRPGLLFGFGQ